MFDNEDEEFRQSLEEMFDDEPSFRFLIGKDLLGVSYTRLNVFLVVDTNPEEKRSYVANAFFNPGSAQKFLDTYKKDAFGNPYLMQTKILDIHFAHTRFRDGSPMDAEDIDNAYEFLRKKLIN